MDQLIFEKEIKINTRDALIIVDMQYDSGVGNSLTNFKKTGMT